MFNLLELTNKFRYNEMKSKLKKITYLFISLLMALLLNNTLIFNNGAQTELSVPKQSDGYSESFIHVDGNWTETATTYDWCYGDGSWSTPYVIENVSINAISSPTGSGIYINNSHDVYFRIQNCTIISAQGGVFGHGAGIELQNCSRGLIFNNTCTDSGASGNGILLEGYNCYNITIERNVVKSSERHGILSYGGNEIYIINNTVSDCYYKGIYLYNGCENFTVAYNYVEDVGHSDQDAGICLYNYNHNNTVYNNTIINSWRGIYLRESRDNSIYNNTVKNNDDAGIILSTNSNYNNVTDNIASNDDEGYDQGYGIWLTGSSYNTITCNTVNNNLIHGIYLHSGCDNNTITENTINDNTDAGIYLISSCDNNVIKNNTINRNYIGITLYQSNYNNISGNILKDNSFCIYETNSVGNIIEYNDCSPPTVQEPININAAATGVGANNWTWAVSQSWCSGSGTWNDPYLIENLKISGFSIIDGIFIYNSDVSFIIQNCSISNAHTGIYLENVNNSRLINNTCSNLDFGIYVEYSNNNTISGNTANGNTYEGIYIYEGDYNYITGNTANDNGDLGIHLATECMDNTLSGNTANGNNYEGIYIEEDCYNNTISGNTANENNYGIYIEEDCYNNTISGNTANGNTYEGITLYDSCSNSIISGNTVNNNGEYGIYLYYGDNSIISGNTINDNGEYGIFLDTYCDYNDIIDNIFYNNTLGIFIDSNCDNNSIYQNFFLENGKHAEDDGTDNTWNSTSIGNYWDNWTTPDVSPNDGIVDAPYTYIGGSAGSIDYLPIAEDGAPVIVINSPTSSDVFGVTAPSFDVTITDVYVDSMWYTIDGGINNYTFIENGIINQTAWAALNEGDVTITFYAKDIIGNEASESVTVVKMISAAGLEPGIIITIVVVSVAGGVAAVAVIYLYLKKRKSPK